MNPFIIAIVFGTGFAILMVTLIYKLLRAWIDRGSSADGVKEQEFAALLHEFEEFKNNITKRIQYLEAIVADQEVSEQGEKKKLDAKNDATDISIDDEIEYEEQSGKNKNDGLKNMLNN